MIRRAYIYSLRMTYRIPIFHIKLWICKRCIRPTHSLYDGAPPHQCREVENFFVLCFTFENMFIGCLCCEHIHLYAGRPSCWSVLASPNTTSSTQRARVASSLITLVLLVRADGLAIPQFRETNIYACITRMAYGARVRLRALSCSARICFVYKRHAVNENVITKPWGAGARQRVPGRGI